MCLLCWQFLISGENTTVRAIRYNILQQVREKQVCKTRSSSEKVSNNKFIWLNRENGAVTIPLTLQVPSSLHKLPLADATLNNLIFFFFFPWQLRSVLPELRDKVRVVDSISPSLICFRKSALATYSTSLGLGLERDGQLHHLQAHPQPSFQLTEVPRRMLQDFPFPPAPGREEIWM